MDEYGEEDYDQEQDQMESMDGKNMGMSGEEMEEMEGEYDQEEESPNGGEGEEEEYGEESMQRSNANPYPKQNPNGGLEQRLE